VVENLWVFDHVGFFLRKKVTAMKPETAANRWELLQAEAHLPQVQAIIRREISRDTIRVVPAPGGGIRIIPASGASPVEEREPFVDRRLEKVQSKTPVLRIESIERKERITQSMATTSWPAACAKSASRCVASMAGLSWPKPSG
jgi:hypothetical protein